MSSPNCPSSTNHTSTYCPSKQPGIPHHNTTISELHPIDNPRMGLVGATLELSFRIEQQRLQVNIEDPQYIAKIMDEIMKITLTNLSSNPMMFQVAMGQHWNLIQTLLPTFNSPTPTELELFPTPTIPLWTLLSHHFILIISSTKTYLSATCHL